MQQRELADQDFRKICEQFDGMMQVGLVNEDMRTMWIGLSALGAINDAFGFGAIHYATRLSSNVWSMHLDWVRTMSSEVRETAANLVATASGESASTMRDLLEQRLAWGEDDKRSRD